MQKRTWLLGAALAALFLAGGCGESPQRTAATAQASGETFKDFGDYEVHFNALRTDVLTPEVARSYGIQRSRNRVMLTVSILHKEADQSPRRPVEGKVQVDAYNLTGQLKNLSMRRLAEGEAIYYIGEVSISGNEILVFDIQVAPLDGSGPFTVKFKREFDSR